MATGYTRSVEDNKLSQIHDRYLQITLITKVICLTAHIFDPKQYF